MMLNIFICAIVGITLGTFQSSVNIRGMQLEKLKPGR